MLVCRGGGGRDFKYSFNNFKRLGLLFNLSGGITQTYGGTVINRNFFNLKLFKFSFFSIFSPGMARNFSPDPGINAIVAKCCEPELKKNTFVWEDGIFVKNRRKEVNLQLGEINQMAGHVSVAGIK